MNHIGQRIKELRKKNDLTQERLADYLGVTDKAVSKWECGATMPDLALIVPLARLLKVSADELLCGKQEEIDQRRSEFDRHCERWMDYGNEENYELARQAVQEYPGDYKYLNWLAHSESTIANEAKYKQDPTDKYNIEMVKSALSRFDTVIEECEDEDIRYDAIWNAMLCCNKLNQYEEARKYAEMFPLNNKLCHTRESALELCLQGNELIEHYKKQVHAKLYDLLVRLSRIYYLTDKMAPHVEEAMNATEAILKAVFPDGNYVDCYGFMCCIYEKRAEFAVSDGDYDGAMEYLRIMFDYAKKVPHQKTQCTHGILDGMWYTVDRALPYLLTPLDDLNKSTFENLKNRVKCMGVLAPLWNRDDLETLFE